MTRSNSLTALAMSFVLVVGACGGTGNEAPAAAGTKDHGRSEALPADAPPTANLTGGEAVPVLPVEFTGADGVTQTVRDVGRIIPLNGDLAEVIFALGLGSSVVATDDSATYPPEADALPSVGYQGDLVAEQVIGHDPTVVVGHPGVGPAGVVEQLRSVGIPVVLVAETATLAGPAEKVRAVARALGVPGRGEDLARQVEAEVAAGEAAGTRAAATGSRPRALFLYVRGERVQMVGGRGSGVDALLRAAGAVDVGTEMGVDDFAPIGAEAVVAARPEVLVVTTAGMASVGGPAGVLALPGVEATPAGRDRRVLAYADQLLLGLGPRAGAMLTTLVGDLHSRE